MTGERNDWRCSARNVDGGRCANWAMAGSDPPRCKVHDPDILRAESKRRCSAGTKAGKRCRNAVVQGRDVCGVHAGLNFVDEAARRAGRVCTAANTRGGTCGRWAVKGSDPPLCSIHGGKRTPLTQAPDEHRCQALTKRGERCRAWRVEVSPGGKALCNVHAGSWRAPGPGERCTATTKRGEPCAQWAVRDSAGQYGVGLCPAHLPDGDRRKPRIGLPEPGQRRCRAITADGERCPHWTLPGEEGGLCWIHAYPHLNPRITHGYYRTVPTYSPAVRAEIARLVAEGRPLQAAVALVRLKLRDAFVYFGDEDLSHAEKDRVARLLFQGAGTVGRLLLAEKGLAGLRWGPYSAGGTGKMLASLAPDSGEPPSSTEAPRP